MFGKAFVKSRQGMKTIRNALPIGLARLIFGGFGLVFLGAVEAFAYDPWQIGFSEPASAIARQQLWFDNFLLWIIIPIAVFCYVMIFIIIARFGAKRNPTPSKTTHNTPLEIAWTVVPVLILLVIAVPSFRVLSDQLLVPDGKRAFNEAILPEPSLTIEVTGNSWFWSYDYRAEGLSYSHDSFVVLGEELEAKRVANPGVDYPRLLAVDEEMIVPVNETVRLLVTADPEGVIHSWFVPQLGVKIDAVPGRFNETWINAEREGIFYGACTELCGRDHSRMPVAVRVVSRDVFEREVLERGGTIASVSAPTVDTAASLRDGDGLGERSASVRPVAVSDPIVSQ